MINEIILNSAFFGIFISILAFEAGVWLKKKFKTVLFNPLLISVIIIIAFLKIFDINYDIYYDGAKYISFLLTPATVCLAVPLYEKINLLRKNFKAILAGIFSGVFSSLAGIFILSKLFGLTHEQYVTLLPKSITTAVGMDLSKELGGVVTITVAVIIITGITGNMLAETVCRLFKITEPVAKGLAIGTASHAVGTAKAMEMGEVEGAVSSLAIVVCALVTVVFAHAFAGLI